MTGVQYGAGTSFGAERVIHYMQLTLDRIGIINGDDEPTDSVTMD